MKFVAPLTEENCSASYLEFTGCRFDEQGGNAISADGYNRIRVQGGGVNINGSAGTGLDFRNSKNIIVENFWMGYPNGDRPLMRLENCGHVLVNGITVFNGPRRILCDKKTQVEIRNSPGVVLDRSLYNCKSND